MRQEALEIPAVKFFSELCSFAASAFSEPDLPVNLAPIEEVTALDKLVKNGSWPQFQLSVVNEDGPLGYLKLDGEEL